MHSPIVGLHCWRSHQVAWFNLTLLQPFFPRFYLRGAAVTSSSYSETLWVSGTFLFNCVNNQSGYEFIRHQRKSKQALGYKTYGSMATASQTRIPGPHLEYEANFWKTCLDWVICLFVHLIYMAAYLSNWLWIILKYIKNKFSSCYSSRTPFLFLWSSSLCPRIVTVTDLL